MVFLSLLFKCASEETAMVGHITEAERQSHFEYIMLKSYFLMKQHFVHQEEAQLLNSGFWSTEHIPRTWKNYQYGKCVVYAPKYRLA